MTTIFWRSHPRALTVRDRDFERALGSEVEVHLFRAMDGVKEFSGVLTAFDAETITLETPAGDQQLLRKACSLIKPVVDMTGVEEVDLSDPEEAPVGENKETEARGET